MTRYEELIERKRTRYGEKFTTTSLDQRFIPAYNSGERITVKLGEMIQKRGTVGVTTGWAPSFILLLTKRSTGSMYRLGPTEDIV